MIKTDPFRSTNSEITEPSFELPGAPSRPFDEKTEKRPKVLNTDEPFVSNPYSCSESLRELARGLGPPCSNDVRRFSYAPDDGQTSTNE